MIQKIGGNNPDTVSWSIDLCGGIQRVAIEHGCSPFGNGKARTVAWNLPNPDPGPPRTDLHATPRSRRQVPDAARRQAVPRAQPRLHRAEDGSHDKGTVRGIPLILTSGRLVDYEGGGEETRSNKWLAELQQDMFVEINPADAAERGIKDRGWVWVTGPENNSKARIESAGHRAHRQSRGVDAVPFRRLVSRASTSAANIPKAPIRSCSARA